MTAQGFVRGFAALPLLVALAARADDNKAPVISDPQASQKSGRVTVGARITDETGVLQALVFWRKVGDSSYEQVNLVKVSGDQFSATFDSKGADDIEYYLQAIDELGNGPSKLGDARSPQSLSSGRKSAPARVARRGGGTKKPKAAEEKPAEEEKAAEEVAGPPVIEHAQPDAQPEGQTYSLEAKITGGGIAKAVGWFRMMGKAKFDNQIPLAKGEGDEWKLEIPDKLAKGTIEYILVAQNTKGQKTQQGNGAPNKPFQLAFKKEEAKEEKAEAKEEAKEEKKEEKPAAEEVFSFAHKILLRTPPGAKISIRAQATPQTEADAPTKMQVLWRGGDEKDQSTDLAADESGGIGGFQGQLPAPAGEGALYYQVVACNKGKCAIDTGSKKSWHSVAVSNDGDAKPPKDIEAVSEMAPAGLPE